MASGLEYANLAAWFILASDSAPPSEISPNSVRKGDVLDGRVCGRNQPASGSVVLACPGDGRAAWARTLRPALGCMRSSAAPSSRTSGPVAAHAHAARCCLVSPELPMEVELGRNSRHCLPPSVNPAESLRLRVYVHSRYQPA